MGSETHRIKMPGWGAGTWEPLVFFAIGLFCFIQNEAMFDIAAGAIFCGIGILFHAGGYWKPKGYHKVTACGQVLGFGLILTGWAYVMWNIGSPWP